jgi:hypothetical protein
MTKQPNGESDARQQLTAYAVERGLDLIFFDPPEYFDHAIIGVVQGFGQEPAVLYDEAKVLAAMAKDMGADDAQEWFDFNTIGAYVGAATPRFLVEATTSRVAARRRGPATR